MPPDPPTTGREEARRLCGCSMCRAHPAEFCSVRYRIEAVLAERDMLQGQVEELKGELELLQRTDAVATMHEQDKLLADIRAQLDAVTRDRDEWASDHRGYLASAKASQELARVIDRRCKAVEADLLAVTKERDAERQLFNGSGSTAIRWLNDLAEHLVDEPEEHEPQSHRLGLHQMIQRLKRDREVAAADRLTLQVEHERMALALEKIAGASHLSVTWQIIDSHRHAAEQALKALSSPSPGAEVGEIREALNIGLRYAKADMPDAPEHSCGPFSACDSECAAYVYQSQAVAKIENALRTLGLGPKE